MTVRGTISGMATRANPAFAAGVVVIAVAGATLASVSSVAGGTPVTLSVQQHTYVHVMAGVLWTGIDVFIGAVLGPVIGGLDEEESAAVFSRLTPKTSFLLPSLAFLTIVSGITLAQRIGVFSHSGPWLALFTAANVVPIVLLLGWRLDARDDRRWQVPAVVLTVASLAWVGLTVGEFRMTEPAVAFALVVVTILSVQGFGFLMPGEVRIYRQMISENPDASVISAIGQQNAKLGATQGLFQLVLVADMVYLRYGGLPFLG
jgi:hypothetical protein